MIKKLLLVSMLLVITLSGCEKKEKAPKRTQQEFTDELVSHLNKKYETDILANYDIYEYDPPNLLSGNYVKIRFHPKEGVDMQAFGVNGNFDDNNKWIKIYDSYFKEILHDEYNEIATKEIEKIFTTYHVRGISVSQMPEEVLIQNRRTFSDVRKQLKRLEDKQGVKYDSMQVLGQVSLYIPESESTNKNNIETRLEEIQKRIETGSIGSNIRVEVLSDAHYLELIELYQKGNQEEIDDFYNLYRNELTQKKYFLKETGGHY